MLQITQWIPLITSKTCCPGLVMALWFIHTMILNNNPCAILSWELWGFSIMWSCYFLLHHIKIITQRCPKHNNTLPWENKGLITIYGMIIGAPEYTVYCFWLCFVNDVVIEKTNNWTLISIGSDPHTVLRAMKNLAVYFLWSRARSWKVEPKGPMGKTFVSSLPPRSSVI